METTSLRKLVMHNRKEVNKNNNESNSSRIHTDQ